jgi:hypothetical protein
MRMFVSVQVTGFRQFDTDHINLSPPPMDGRPRVFQAGSIIDTDTFHRIAVSVYGPTAMVVINDDADANDDEEEEEELREMPDRQPFDSTVLTQARDREIEHLTQVIRSEQPDDDDLARFIMQQLNSALDTTSIAANASSAPTTTTDHLLYPPMHQTGPVADHDRPYADYGHLGECK